MNDHFNRISAIIIRQLEGEQLSTQEQYILDEWLRASPQNRELLSQLRDPQYVKEELGKMYGYNLDEGWQRLKIKFDANKNTAVIQKYSKWKYWIAAAIILFALAGAALLCEYFPAKVIKIADQTNKKPATDIAAPAISKATITLHDGTRIAIDSTNTGNLAKQGKTIIQKTADGQIQYTADEKLNAETQFNTLTNPRGSRVVQLTLSDGTKVWLNAESEIRYPVTHTTGKKSRNRRRGIF